MAAGATDARARKCLELSRRLKELGETPREAQSGEWAAAQSSMASLGYELAGVFLDALGGIPETPADKLADKLAAAKSLAQQVLDECHADTGAFLMLKDAIALIGRCQDEIEGGA